MTRSTDKKNTSLVKASVCQLIDLCMIINTSLDHKGVNKSVKLDRHLRLFERNNYVLEL